MVAAPTDASGYSDGCASRFHYYRVQRQLCLSGYDNPRPRSQRAGYYCHLIAYAHNRTPRVQSGYCRVSSR